jgi:REP element-mobilizing transposase RayT
MKSDTNSLAHTKWNCKYHIVFAPKYRRKVFYGEKRLEIGVILRSLCEWKEVEIQRLGSDYTDLVPLETVGFEPEI